MWWPELHVWPPYGQEPGDKSCHLGWQRGELRDPSPSQRCQAVKLNGCGTAWCLELLLFKIISPPVYKPLWEDIPVPLSQKHLRWYTGLQRGSLQRGFNRREWKEGCGREGCLLPCPDPLPHGHPSGQTSYWWGNTGHLLFECSDPKPGTHSGLLRSRTT